MLETGAHLARKIWDVGVGVIGVAASEHGV
jgi:hypothetical protein